MYLFSSVFPFSLKFFIGIEDQAFFNYAWLDTRIKQGLLGSS